MPADGKKKKSKPTKMYESLLDSGELLSPSYKPLETRQPQLALSPQTAAPTPASEWRSARKAAFMVTLPSGQNMRVRRTMSLAKRMRDGTIPNPLATVVTEMIESGRKHFDESDMTPEAIVQMIEMIDDTVVEMVVVPPVVKPPADADLSWEPPYGSISTMDIDFEDKVFLYQVAQGGVTDLAQFREITKQFMAPAQPVEGVGGSPE